MKEDKPNLTEDEQLSVIDGFFITITRILLLIAAGCIIIKLFDFISF